jgi:hypothetical protein
LTIISCQKFNEIKNLGALALLFFWLPGVPFDPPLEGKTEHPRRFKKCEQSIHHLKEFLNED